MVRPGLEYSSYQEPNLNNEQIRGPRLVASYYTLAGPVVAGGGDDASPFSLERRAAAAARAGYWGLGLSTCDLQHLLTKHTFKDIHNIIADAGLKFTELECLTGWFDEGSTYKRSKQIWGKYLEAAEKMGVSHFKTAGNVDMGNWSTEHMAARFRSLCQDADQVGAYLSIELFPISNIADIRTGRAIIEQAACRNGGLLLDIWHITRKGISYDEISALPAAFIKHVELNDADEEVLGSLWDDTTLRRRLPGRGAFDIPSFLRSVRATGYDGPYGVEILADAQRALSPEDAAKMSYDATLSQFANRSAVAAE
jgi:sugar phosphate isomerase/epimerase